MKKVLLITLAAFVGVVNSNSQVTLKKDLSTYYDQLPAMPSSLQDAYAKCNCKSGCRADSLVAPLKRNMQGDEKTMGTLTKNNQQQLANGQQISKDTKGMNDQQKLEYAKNSPTMNGGGNSQAQFAFAQKMQNDPSEKAKLQAMSPQEKMAYLQQNGMLGGGAYPQAGMPGAAQPTAASPATPADDPKMDSAISASKRMQYGNSDKSKLLAAMEYQSNSTRLDSAHNVIAQQQNAEVAALPKYSGNEAGVDPAKYNAINSKYLQRHIQLATTQLQSMTKAYNDLSTWLKTNDAGFNTALAAANYGYKSDGSQDDNMATLTNGQAVILGDVSGLADYAKTIYEFAAGWQNKQVQAQQH